MEWNYKLRIISQTSKFATLQFGDGLVILYNGYNHLYILVLKLIRLGKGNPWIQTYNLYGRRLHILFLGHLLLASSYELTELS